MSGRIVVTGLGAVSALGLSAEETWIAARDGVGGIAKVLFDPGVNGPEGHTTAVAMVKGDALGALEAALGRRVGNSLDSFSIYALKAAHEALAQAGLAGGEGLGTRAGSGSAVAGAGGKTGDDVYIEAAVEPRAPYVQQQVSLTVKLYFAVNLTDGSLDEPQVDGLVVRKLGQDANYAADVGGRRYRVLERHYALLPEKSGAVSLPPIAFRGHAMDVNRISLLLTTRRGLYS